MCVVVLLGYISGYGLCARCLWSLGTGVTDSYELLCGCWEPNHGPLEEPLVLVTVEPSSAPCLWFHLSNSSGWPHLLSPPEVPKGWGYRLASRCPAWELLESLYIINIALSRVSALFSQIKGVSSFLVTFTEILATPMASRTMLSSDLCAPSPPVESRPPGRALTLGLR